MTTGNAFHVRRVRVVAVGVWECPYGTAKSILCQAGTFCVVWWGMRLPVQRWLFTLLGWCGVPVAWEVSSGAVVFRNTPDGREYLLLRYPSGHFDYPRGHVEAGETRLVAARREVLEETGIEAVELFAEKEMYTKFFYIARGSERARRREVGRGTWIFKEVFMYPGETAVRAVVLSHEHPEFVWLPYAAALEKVTYENAKTLLRQTESWARARDKKE